MAPWGPYSLRSGRPAFRALSHVRRTPAPRRRVDRVAREAGARRWPHVALHSVPFTSMWTLRASGTPSLPGERHLDASTFPYEDRFKIDSGITHARVKIRIPAVPRNFGLRQRPLPLRFAPGWKDLEVAQAVHSESPLNIIMKAVMVRIRLPCSARKSASVAGPSTCFALSRKT